MNLYESIRHLSLAQVLVIASVGCVAEVENGGPQEVHGPDAGVTIPIRFAGEHISRCTDTIVDYAAPACACALDCPEVDGEAEAVCEGAVIHTDGGISLGVCGAYDASWVQICGFAGIAPCSASEACVNHRCLEIAQ